MNNNKLYPNPFGWDETEQRGLTSFYTQRQASYKTPAKEVYNGTERDVFFHNVEAPTPQLAEVDGYKSESEIAAESGTPEAGE